MRQRRTELLTLVARKLSPFIFLFGAYLVAFGHVSPGGGFQGGVVVASGLILLVLSERQRGGDVRGMGRGARVVTAAETLAFGLLLLVGVAGMLWADSFLGNPVPKARFLRMEKVGFVFVLNVLIGIKVSAGVGLIAMVLFREEQG